MKHNGALLTRNAVAPRGDRHYARLSGRYPPSIEAVKGNDLIAGGSRIAQPVIRLNQQRGRLRLFALAHWIPAGFFQVRNGRPRLACVEIELAEAPVESGAVRGFAQGSFQMLALSVSRNRTRSAWPGMEPPCPMKWSTWHL